MVIPSHRKIRVKKAVIKETQNTKKNKKSVHHDEDKVIEIRVKERRIQREID
jgi:hypothetical protein